MGAAAFVEKAMRSAHETKDNYLVSNISDLFLSCDSEGEDINSQITLEEFKARMNRIEMQEYFKAIDLDPSESMGIFSLLDVDGSGSVDREEIVHGCLRLRGSAKALE